MKKLLFFVLAFTLTTTFTGITQAKVCPVTDYAKTCPEGQIKQKSMFRGCGYIETCVPTDTIQCPMIYAPVCGLDNEGNLNTYINHCEARTAGADVMYESQCVRTCPDVYTPVCAMTTGGDMVTYQNECEAKIYQAQILHTHECLLNAEGVPSQVTPQAALTNDWPVVEWSHLTPSYVNNFRSHRSVQHQNVLRYNHQIERRQIFRGALLDRLQDWRRRK